MSAAVADGPCAVGVPEAVLPEEVGRHRLAGEPWPRIALRDLPMRNGRDTSARGQDAGETV